MIIYAYMRTRIALEHDDSLRGLWDYLRGYGVTFSLAKNGEIIEWEDGIVIKIDHWLSMDWHIQHLHSFLDELDAWVLFDGVKLLEHPKGGLLTSFLESGDRGSTPERYAQIFVKYGYGSRNRERLIESIRKRIGDLCQPVFYFRDGMVLLVKSDISGRIINQQCRNCLENLRAWIIIDASNEYHSDTGPVDSVWSPLKKTRPLWEKSFLPNNSS